MLKIQFTTPWERWGFYGGNITQGQQPWLYDTYVNQRICQEIKNQGCRIVRLDFNSLNSMDAYSPGEYDQKQKEYHKQVFSLLADMNLIPMIVLNSEVPFMYSYRKMLSDYTGDVKYLDINEFKKATNRRKTGIPKVFWKPINKHMEDIIRLGAEIYASKNKQWAGNSFVETDNENGYILDSEYAEDRTIIYGTYHESFNEMQYDRMLGKDAINFYGSLVLAPAYENMQGIDRELATTMNGVFRQYTHFENLHLYVKWVAGDTQFTFASKLVAALNSFITKLDALNDPYRSGKQIAITEFGGIDIPIEVRKNVLIHAAKKLNTHPRVICAIAYSMIDPVWQNEDFVRSRWAILDFETIKYGATTGYVPFDYNTVPISRTFGLNWTCENTFPTGNFSKECVSQVGSSLVLATKKLHNGIGPVWATNNITSQITGPGKYTFNFEGDLKSLKIFIKANAATTLNSKVDIMNITNQLITVNVYNNANTLVNTDSVAYKSNKLKCIFEHNNNILKWEIFDNNILIYSKTFAGTIDNNSTINVSSGLAQTIEEPYSVIFNSINYISAEAQLDNPN